MSNNKCNVINADVYQKGSQVLVLAFQNQFLNDYRRDNDGSAVGQQQVATAQGMVNETVGIVNSKYASTLGAIDNITWDDFTHCPSMAAKKDSNGNLVTDANGNPVYKNFDRDSLATLGYKPHTKYMADTRPLKDNSLMKSACTLVPIWVDGYYPPEVVVCFVLFVVFLLLTLLMVALMSGGDDHDAAPDYGYGYGYGYQYGYQ